MVKYAASRHLVGVAAPPCRFICVEYSADYFDIMVLLDFNAFAFGFFRKWIAMIFLALAWRGFELRNYLDWT